MLEGVDAVVNVGGLSNDPTAEYNPRANHEMNTRGDGGARAALQGGGRAPVRPRLVLLDLRLRASLDEGADVLQDETAPVAPRAPYSLSKYEAERDILPMADAGFCPVALRKGTIYGYSPRMRYDLVVNTFVRDALIHRRLTLHHGGEMWRPLVDVRDAAQAYIALVEAEDAAVRGEVFNLCYRNLRISELALRVQEALRRLGIDVDVRPDYHHGSVRNYRVSGDKIARVLNFRPKVSIEESVTDMVQRIRADGRMDSSRTRATTTSAGSSCSRTSTAPPARPARSSTRRPPRFRSSMESWSRSSSSARTASSAAISSRPCPPRR